MSFVKNETVVNRKMESKIRFLSLNIGMKNNLAGLPVILINQKVDIAFLQEVKVTDEELQCKVGRLGYECKVNINLEDLTKPGTALVWRSTLPVRDVNSLVICKAQVAYLEDYALLNLYAPSGSDKRYERSIFFSQDIFKALSLHPESKWLVGGDFNCVLLPMDVENGTGYDQKRCPQLADLTRIKKLSDAFRSLNPNKREYTFFRTSAAPSRLDRFYVPADLLNKVKHVDHVASLSDHCGVVMEIDLNVGSTCIQKEIRNTYWKLNNSILKDDEFLDNFTECWKWIQSTKLDHADIADWWDVVAKPSIKEFCILFSTRRNNRRKDNKRFWFSYLKIVLQSKKWEEVARVKEKLTKLLEEDSAGYVIRSRFKNNASNEVASLYHANQEMKNSKKNSLNKLKIDGVVESDAKVIEDKVVHFFNALFNGHHDAKLVDTGVPFVPDYSGLDSYLDGIGSLPDMAKDELESVMTMEELREIVKESANNKSPGLDGISYEFYKVSLDLIENDLLQVFQCQLDRRRIVDSNTEGVTRLGSKVDGVPSVDELRPITLLNCDYKLLSKWFVKRVRPKLPFIIKSGQLCTVGKKNILFGVSNVLSSLLQVKQARKSACMISLDFFKAYDRVLLDFLVKVMEKMNFGKVFISWMLMLHKGARTRFLLGFLTRAIEVRFSIRQGDPLAMILYIIYIEPLLIALERSLVGLRLATIKQTLEAYCDDVNLLTDDLEDFGRMEDLVVKFENLSGALLSRNKKCQVVGFGGWAKKESWPIDWLKPVRSVKIFGVFVCDNYSELLKTNWEFRFEKFRNAIFSWSSRMLSTLQQRVEVIRVFAFSRVFYISSILPIKSSMVKKFESLVGKFIWQGAGRILRVALNELKNENLSGGLNLPCLTTMSDALLTSKCLRLFRSGDTKSVAHLDYWMGSLVADIVPGLGLGEQAADTPEYFGKLGDCLAALMVSDLLTASSLSTITNKMIYKDISSFPTPKVENGSVVDYKLVWKRLDNSVIDSEVRNVMFLLIHNKLPVSERMFRIGVKVDPYCSHCPGAEVDDVEHFFCYCERTRQCWSWVRLKISGLCGQGLRSSNWELLNFVLPKTQFEQGILWLIGNYVHYAWEQCHGRSSRVFLEKFFGFLTFKYKNSGVSLGQNFGLG